MADKIPSFFLNKTTGYRLKKLKKTGQNLRFSNVKIHPLCCW